MNLLKDDARAYIAEQYQTTRRKEFRLFNDYEFKAVFGQDNERSKQALMSLLNAILDRKDDPITAIRILNPIIIGQTDTSKGGICRRVPTLRSNSRCSLLSVSSANRFRSLDEKARAEALHS